jgi:hypothetical protein
MNNKKYELSLSRETTEATSNISYLLDSQHEEFLRSISPALLEEVFGPGSECFIPSKGYEDDEWYWKSSDGNVLGVGWRWGQSRLRGKGVKKPDQMISHPDKLSAYEFVEFLKEELSFHNTPVI